MSDAQETSSGTPDSLVGLIDQLIEAPPPDPVSMLPQTAGWLWLLAGIVLATALVIRWRIRVWHANTYRRAALAELDAAGTDSAAIAEILRRTALAVWPRTEIANLTGPAWIAFLNSTGGQGQFSGPVGKTLVAAPYRCQPPPASPDLQAAARHWIRQHKADPAS